MDNPNTPVKHLRQLKVYQKSSQRAYKYVSLPEIRLMGKWLQKAGFKCGQNVRVLHQKNRIVITNEERIVVVL